MKTIEIDDDLYALIASQTERIGGETASDILRRLLTKKPAQVSKPEGGKKHELSTALADPNLRFLSSKDRFLTLLSEGYRQRKAEFDKVLSLKGRGRIYFAKSEQEIAESGNSTHPQQIPATNYWVMTNASNVKKAQMLHDALQVLGFSEEACRAAKALLWKGR